MNKFSFEQGFDFSSHKKYLRLPFTPNVPEELFSEEEWELLCHYGSWLAALMRRDIPAFTVKQTRFIEVCAGKRQPYSTFEKVWSKYMARKAWEMKNPQVVELYQFAGQLNKIALAKAA